MRFLIVLLILITLSLTACQSHQNHNENRETAHAHTDAAKAVDNEVPVVEAKYQEENTETMTEDAAAEEPTTEASVPETIEEAPKAIVEKEADPIPELTEKSITIPTTKADEQTTTNHRTSGLAKATVDKKTVEFGTLIEGEKFNHKFKVTNTGKEELLIENVKTSCGCTAANYSFMPVPPGESTYIEIEFDSKDKFGSQRKNITVTTNGYPRNFKLVLTGEVMTQKQYDERQRRLKELGITE